jgi:hypothetical protein
VLECLADPRAVVCIRRAAFCDLQMGREDEAYTRIIRVNVSKQACCGLGVSYCEAEFSDDREQRARPQASPRHRQTDTELAPRRVSCVAYAPCRLPVQLSNPHNSHVVVQPEEQRRLEHTPGVSDASTSALALVTVGRCDSFQG